MEHSEDSPRDLARDLRAYLHFLRDGGLVFAGAEAVMGPAPSPAPSPALSPLASAAVAEARKTPVQGAAAPGDHEDQKAPTPAHSGAPVPAPSDPAAASPAPAGVARSAVAPAPTAPTALTLGGAGLPPEERGPAWQALCEEIARCKACRLHESRTNTVPGVGSLTADLMFIGEGPGGEEDRQGEPFVGRAGQKLNEMIAYMGLTREKVCIVNIVKCRPPGNRNPERDEAAACRAFLDRQIAIVQPRVLCLVGAVALKHITGKMTVFITRARGQWMEYAGIPTLATLHPAYLLRAYTRENRMAVASDMDALREKLLSLGCPVGDRPGAQ